MRRQPAQVNELPFNSGRGPEPRMFVAAHRIALVGVDKSRRDVPSLPAQHLARVLQASTIFLDLAEAAQFRHHIVGLEVAV